MAILAGAEVIDTVDRPKTAFDQGFGPGLIELQARVGAAKVVQWLSGSVGLNSLSTRWEKNAEPNRER
jgi:hypothetical protein